MRNFQHKKKRRRIIESPPVLILLAILFLIFAWKMVGFWGKMRATAENRHIAKEKIEELKSEQARLTADISRLGTEEGVEESIREKFGLAKEGEELIVVVEEQNKGEENADQKKGGFFSFFKKLFGKE